MSFFISSIEGFPGSSRWHLLLQALILAAGGLGGFAQSVGGLFTFEDSQKRRFPALKEEIHINF